MSLRQQCLYDRYMVTTADVTADVTAGLFTGLPT